MHFRVFLPNVGTANPEHLRSVGLAHLIPGATFLFSELNDVPGLIVSWGGEDPGCDVTQFNWIPAEESNGLPEGRYQVGLKINSPPMPHELAWPKLFDGYLITLGDGNDWCIPSAGMLPQSIKMRGNGVAVRQVKKEFKSYFDDSVKWFADVVRRDFSELNQTFDGEVFSYLARALMLNYRLTPEVIQEFEMFDTTNLKDCLLASISGIDIAREIDNQITNNADKAVAL